MLLPRWRFSFGWICWSQLLLLEGGTTLWGDETDNDVSHFRQWKRLALSGLTTQLTAKRSSSSSLSDKSISDISRHLAEPFACSIWFFISFYFCQFELPPLVCQCNGKSYIIRLHLFQVYYERIFKRRKRIKMHIKLSRISPPLSPLSSLSSITTTATTRVSMKSWIA